MLAKKHSFTRCPATNHQNAANLTLQTYEKTNEHFYGTARASTLALEIMFLTLVPFQKFSFQQDLSIIPWFD